METKYYNRSNNFSAPIKKEPKPYSPEPQKSPCVDLNTPEKNHKTLLLGFQNDDLLILALIFLLLGESNEDSLLIILLGYLFLSSRK